MGENNINQFDSTNYIVELEDAINEFVKIESEGLKIIRKIGITCDSVLEGLNIIKNHMVITRAAWDEMVERERNDAILSYVKAVTF